MTRDCHDRYMSDPVFHALVSQFSAILEREPGITPSDIREAALYASVRYEATHIRPMVIQRGDYFAYEPIRRPNDLAK